MSNLKINRVFIEHEECTATSLCHSELPPNSITYEKVSDANYDASVLHQEKFSRTKESLLSMLAAADVCPTDAFYVELKDGTIMNVYDDFLQKKIHLKEVEWS